MFNYHVCGILYSYYFIRHLCKLFLLIPECVVTNCFLFLFIVNFNITVFIKQKTRWILIALELLGGGWRFEERHHKKGSGGNRPPLLALNKPTNERDAVKQLDLIHSSSITKSCCKSSSKTGGTSGMTAAAAPGFYQLLFLLTPGMEIRWKWWYEGFVPHGGVPTAPVQYGDPATSQQLVHDLRTSCICFYRIVSWIFMFFLLFLSISHCQFKFLPLSCCWLVLQVNIFLLLMFVSLFYLWKSLQLCNFSLWGRNPAIKVWKTGGERDLACDVITEWLRCTSLLNSLLMVTNLLSITVLPVYLHCPIK